MNRYDHGSVIYVVRACYNDDATDLVAIGGEHSVDVLQITATGCNKLASFHIGSRVTALAWSSRSLSPASSDDWILELTASGANFGLHLLTKAAHFDATIFDFGGGIHGHNGKINDMSFCGGGGHDSARYVATVSDDRMLMVWDLYPAAEVSSPGIDSSASPPAAPRPTAYVIAFPHPLITINSHPSTSKEFLVSDSRGSIFLTDWRSDPEDGDEQSWRHRSLVELVEPRALSGSLGHTAQWTGTLGWRRDSVEIVGATYGSTFSIWDMSKLQGGKPSATGVSFSDGGRHFRWCPNFPEYFAIAARSPSNGAVVQIHDMRYVPAQPSVITVAPKPHIIRDFDFITFSGTAVIAAAVGRELVMFKVNLDS